MDDATAGEVGTREMSRRGGGPKAHNNNSSSSGSSSCGSCSGARSIESDCPSLCVNLETELKGEGCDRIRTSSGARVPQDIELLCREVHHKINEGINERTNSINPNPARFAVEVLLLPPFPSGAPDAG